MLIATQNPVELEGTFPLPEAQLDRFSLKIKIGYPSQDDEETILSRFQKENPLENLGNVIENKELLKLQHLCRQVYVEDSVRNYVTTITRATRNHQDVQLGASPRASLSLHIAAQSLAAIRGRNYVIPDDVKYLAIPGLGHRLITKTEARLKGRTVESILAEIVAGVPVPVEGKK